MMKHTKIVTTIGPASDSTEIMQKLIEAGANIFRLNFSHGDHKYMNGLIARIKELSAQLKFPVAILADLQGPKIRVGTMQDNILLCAGEKLTITTQEVIGDATLIPTTYKALPSDVKIGNNILMDDGLISLMVESVTDETVCCTVVTGGILKSRKGINLPGVDVSADSLTPKDRKDLDFAIEHEVDYIALSFVRSAEDVNQLKEIIKSKGSDIPVIAKIEKPEAVEHFDSILAVTDGIMVARGDLGVEMRAEKVPMIQKMIIKACNLAGKPVITATQMLESMVNSPVPTRAETSDVANSILDGTDAVMLSAETASGSYPEQAVLTMTNIAIDIENTLTKPNRFITNKNVQGITEAIGQAASCVAQMTGAKAILAFTQTGSTAKLVAKYRPCMLVYASTPCEKVQRRLALYSGIYSLLTENTHGTESQIQLICRETLKADLLTKEDTVVVTMGSPSSSTGSTNLLKAIHLKDLSADI